MRFKQREKSVIDIIYDFFKLKTSIMNFMCHQGEGKNGGSQLAAMFLYQKIEDFIFVFVGTIKTKEVTGFG